MRQSIKLDIEELVRLYYDECLSYQEIADIYHVSAPTVSHKLKEAGYKRLSYGAKRASKRAKLREQVNPQGEPEKLPQSKDGSCRYPKKYDTLEYHKDTYRIMYITDGNAHIKLVEQHYKPVKHGREMDVSYSDLVSGLTPYKLLDLPPVRVGMQKNGFIEWEENETNEDTK